MANISNIDILVLAILLVFFLAFSLGYARGRRKGQKEGEAESVLKLKTVSYRTGKCLVCGYVQEKSYIVTNTNKYRKEEQSSEHEISVPL